MQTEVILVVGKRGTGKTTWARNFVSKFNRVLIADAGFGEFPFQAVPPGDFASLCVSLRKSFYRLTYTPFSWEWPHLLNAAMSSGRDGGPLWLVLEEASRLPPPRACEEYERILIMGRHYGINLLALSTRPSHLPPDYRSQATRVVAFRQHEARDLEYLEGIMGDRARQLPALQGHSFIDWTDKEPPEWSKDAVVSPVKTSEKPPPDPGSAQIIPDGEEKA